MNGFKPRTIYILYAQLLGERGFVASVAQPFFQQLADKECRKNRN